MDRDETEVRRLSSAWTPLYRSIVPIVWVIVAAAFALSTYIDPTIFDAYESRVRSRWQVVVMVFAAIAFLHWLCARLKTVDLRGDTLLIRGRQVEIEVPLQSVKRFSGSVFLQPELIWIHFRQPTEVGSKVVFVAPWRLFGIWTENPLVEELNGMIVP